MVSVDHPRMVFKKGTLHYEGHSVTFDIKDDYVEVMNDNGLGEITSSLKWILIKQLRNKKIY